MTRRARVAGALLGAALCPAVFAQSAGSDTPGMQRKSPYASPCESIVVVRCARRANTPGNASETQRGLDAARADLASDRMAAGDDSGRVVIYGIAPKSKLQTLREVIQSAAPPLGAMTFRTVPNGDGTQCTCAGPPCVINCCVCSGAR